MRAVGGGVELVVWVTPRASRNELSYADGALRVRLTAPPHEGRANTALRRLVADCLDVPPTAVELTGGASSRQKTLRVGGLDEAQARRRLADGCRR